MTLTFMAALETGEEGDTVQIFGKPDLEVKLKGTNGDIATVAIVVNAVRRVREAPPGLATMRDLPPVDLHPSVTNGLPMFKRTSEVWSLHLHHYRQDHRPPLRPAVQNSARLSLILPLVAGPGLWRLSASTIV